MRGKLASPKKRSRVRWKLLNWGRGSSNPSMLMVFSCCCSCCCCCSSCCSCCCCCSSCCCCCCVCSCCDSCSLSDTELRGRKNNSVDYHVTKCWPRTSTLCVYGCSFQSLTKSEYLSMHLILQCKRGAVQLLACLPVPGSNLSPFWWG